jgi:hypothetical protein
MSDKWFYIHLGKMCGPVTADELNELAETGGLDARDLIWRVGASPKDAVRAGGCLIFFLGGGTPTPPPVEESPPLAMPVAPASPAPPTAAPDWLSDLADVADETADSPSPSPLDWLQDVQEFHHESTKDENTNG